MSGRRAATRIAQQLRKAGAGGEWQAERPWRRCGDQLRRFAADAPKQSRGVSAAAQHAEIRLSFAPPS
jgi:hypothetical protein